MKKFTFDAEEYESCLPDFKKVLLCLESKYDFFNYYGDARSMMNVELSQVYWFLKKYKPKVFFESGIWWGRCTYIVAESMRQLGMEIPYYIAATSQYKKEKRIRTLLKDYPNITAVWKPGEVTAGLIPASNDIAMLIDGPKWRHAAKMKKLYKSIMRKSRILFSVHHDAESVHNVTDMRILKSWYSKHKKHFTLWRPRKHISKNVVKFIDPHVPSGFGTAVLISRDLI